MGYENLLKKELPEGVTREEQNGLFFIKWTDKIVDEDQLVQVLMTREEFIFSNVSLALALDFDFNEYGDENLYNISSLDKVSDNEDFFNYYDNEWSISYKLMVLNEDFKMNVESEKKIMYYAQNRKMDSGDPIDDIVLILPSRDAAIAVEQYAIKIGVYKVLYLDNDANVWNLRPNGNWRN